MPTITADETFYVDMGDDPDFPGGSFISVYPERLAFDDEIRGVGNISFQISFGTTDQDGDLVVDRHDRFGPWRSYFRLRFGNVGIIAGVVTGVNTKLGSDFVSYYGKTWEVYFTRWQYPFDPRPTERTPGDPYSAPAYDYQHPNHYTGDELVGSGRHTPYGSDYEANNRDVIRILSDLFGTIQNVPHRMIFDISNLAGLSGIKTNYQLSVGDTSYFDTMIDGLAGTGQGFDWWVSTTRKFYWATPYRFGNPASPSIAITFDDKDMFADLDFTNNGPTSTHTLGAGAGLAKQTTLQRAFGYVPAQEQFTRLDAAYDFGDVRNVNQLIEKTQRQHSHDLQPQHVIPLSVYPEKVTNFWSSLRKGRAIYIDMDMTAHRIDSAQQIKKYSANVDLQGNGQVDFELEQIYDLSYNAGSAEG